MRTRLNIPDHEITSAKSLGAQFDKTKNEWFVENKDDLVPYLRWMDKRITGPCKPVLCFGDERYPLDK